MQSLKFRQLLLLSDTTKRANQFVFKKGRNLITANDNSVGKTTLVKLLFWGLGCQPTFDTKWSNHNCKVIVEFSIGDTLYYVKRDNTQIAIKKKDDNTWDEFNRISGKYAAKLAEILHFKALLPSRTTATLETPPPAYYFLPFYIDQKKSWSKAWDNFEALGQYENWKKTIIEYHIGLLNSEYFELLLKKTEEQNNCKNIQEDINKLDTTLETLSKYVPQLTIATIEESKFQKNLDEIRIELKDLQIQQETLLESFSYNQSEKSYLEQQKTISEKIILELEKDYLFALENIDNTITCPLCGTKHDNSILHRSSILVDKTQAINQLTKIEAKLTKLNAKLNLINRELSIIKNRITTINKKYITPDNKEISIKNIIENIAGNSIKDFALINKEKLSEKINETNKEIININKKLTSLKRSKNSADIKKSFIDIFTNYIEIFGSEALDVSTIKSPLDYNKIINEGGAAESCRAILAYYLSIFTMVTMYSNEVVAPLIIDTPRQQEQSDFNYEKIVDFLTSNVSPEVQIFLCGMDNSILNSFKKDANIILLDNDQLLLSKEYEKIKSIFHSL